MSTSYPAITKKPGGTTEIVVPGFHRLDDNAYFVRRETTGINGTLLPVLFLFVYHLDQSSDIYLLSSEEEEEREDNDDPMLRYSHQIWHSGRGVRSSLYHELRQEYGISQKDGSLPRQNTRKEEQTMGGNTLCPNCGRQGISVRKVNKYIEYRCPINHKYYVEVEQQAMSQLAWDILRTLTCTKIPMRYRSAWEIQDRLDLEVTTIQWQYPQNDVDHAMKELIDRGLVEEVPDLGQRFQIVINTQ